MIFTVIEDSGTFNDRRELRRITIAPERGVISRIRVDGKEIQKPYTQLTIEPAACGDTKFNLPVRHYIPFRP